MKKKILFIVNPISGNGRKDTIGADIEATLDLSRFDYEIVFTAHAGHATELAAEAAAAGVPIVVAVGGDGTVNEVARAVVHTGTALAIIPCGSGNGLARHLQIPQNARGALEVINKATVHCLDYCKINGHPFFCTCGVGFDAFVSKKFAESGKRGLLSYVRNTVSIGLKYKPDTYIIENESGTEKHEAFLIACANASQYGNNAYIAPEASMKDGLMDIIVIRPFSTFEGGIVALQMFTRTLLSNNHVRMFKADKLHITRSTEGAVHCDGEPMVMGRDIEVELVRKSFNVVVNPDAHARKKNVMKEVAERVLELLRPIVPTEKLSPRTGDDKDDAEN